MRLILAVWSSHQSLWQYTCLSTGILDDGCLAHRRCIRLRGRVEILVADLERQSNVILSTICFVPYPGEVRCAKSCGKDQKGLYPRIIQS